MEGVEKAIFVIDGGMRKVVMAEFNSVVEVEGSIEVFPCGCGEGNVGLAEEVE